MSRCFSYARQLREQAEPVFFSLASAIEIIREMGFPADYFVSPNWSCANSSDWNCELCFRLGLMLEHVRPAVIVFDGVWPYPGVMGIWQGGRGLTGTDFLQFWWVWFETWFGLGHTGRNAIFGNFSTHALLK